MTEPRYEKTGFLHSENKDADQLRGNSEADQLLCFRYTDSTIPLLPKPEISSFYPSSVAAQFGLCQTLSETPKTGFLTTRLMWSSPYVRAGNTYFGICSRVSQPFGKELFTRLTVCSPFDLSIFDIC